MLKLTVDPQNKGQRLDIFLSYHINTLSRNQVKQLIYAGTVEVNGAKVVAGNHKVNTGDEVAVHIDASQRNETESDTNIVPWDYPVEVLFEDDNLLIINKPAGINVHFTHISDHRSITNAVYNYLLNTSKQKTPYLRLMHRLDQLTSGVLVFSKSPKYTHLLSQLFQKSALDKTYVAIVRGEVIADPGQVFELRNYLRYDSVSEKQYVADSGTFAQTNVEFVGYMPQSDVSVLKVKILTGRKHQIRVQLAHASYPILGDIKYDGPKASRLFLHAYSMGFNNLPGYEDLEVIAPIPAEFQKYCRKLRL